MRYVWLVRKAAYRRDTEATQSLDVSF